MDEWEIVEEPGDWEIVEESPYNSESEEKQKWTESPLMSGVYGATSKFDKMFHGMLQPLLESGLLGKKVSGGSKEVARDRKALDKRSSDINPWSHLFGEMGAEGLMAVPAVGTGIGVTGRLAPGLSKFLKTALGSGLGYGAQGATEYADEDEFRTSKGLSNAAIGTALPMLGKALQVGGKGIKEGYNYAKNIPKSLSPSKISDKIIRDADLVKKQYGTRYKDFFESAKKSGIKEVEVPEFNSKSLIKSAEKNETRALRKFLNKPSLKNAHDAQSDLGKLVGSLKKSKKMRGLNSDERIALNSANKARTKIKSSIEDALNKKDASALAKEYKDLSSGYKKDVLSYEKNPVINKYREGELTDKDFIKLLGSNKKARKQFLGKYPEVDVHNSLPYVLTTMGIGGTGIYKGWPYLFGSNEGSE